MRLEATEYLVTKPTHATPNGSQALRFEIVEFTPEQQANLIEVFTMCATLCTQKSSEGLTVKVSQPEKNILELEINHLELKYLLGLLNSEYFLKAMILGVTELRQVCFSESSLNALLSTTTIDAYNQKSKEHEISGLRTAAEFPRSFSYIFAGEVSDTAVPEHEKLKLLSYSWGLSHLAIELNKFSYQLPGIAKSQHKQVTDILKTSFQRMIPLTMGLGRLHLDIKLTDEGQLVFQVGKGESGRLLSYWMNHNYFNQALNAIRALPKIQEEEKHQAASDEVHTLEAKKDVQANRDKVSATMLGVRGITSAQNVSQDPAQQTQEETVLIKKKWYCCC